MYGIIDIILDDFENKNVYLSKEKEIRDQINQLSEKNK